MYYCEKLERYIDDLASYRLHATYSGELFCEIIDEIKAQMGNGEDFRSVAREAVQRVCSIMPPYATLANVLNRICLSLEGVEPESMACGDGKRMEAVAMSLIREGMTVCTFTFSQTVSDCFVHCAAKKKFSVIVTQSAPNYDGMDTAKLLREKGISCTVVPDADMAWAARKADMALFGCEAILSDGSAVTKVGQSEMSRCCAAKQKPVYVYAGMIKMMPGPLYSLVERTKNRFTLNGVSHRYFDVTPANHITGVITEMGVISPNGLSDRCGGRVSEYLLEHI